MAMDRIISAALAAAALTRGNKDGFAWAAASMLCLLIFDWLAAAARSGEAYPYIMALMMVSWGIATSLSAFAVLVRW